MISKTTTALILALLTLVGTITAGTSISVVPAYADHNDQGEDGNDQGEDEDDLLNKLPGLGD